MEDIRDFNFYHRDSKCTGSGHLSSVPLGKIKASLISKIHFAVELPAGSQLHLAL